MKRLHSALAVGFVLLATPALATTTFEFIFDNAHPLSVSYDGAVITGTRSTGGFETFRWTQATGLVPLGRIATVGGGGVPGISGDGEVIGSSIGAVDSSYSTQGIWKQATGWQELMPPVPPDGGSTDGSYGSVWDISGDGTTPVGLYWRHGFGSAHASKWTQATGVVDLGGWPSNRSSRANGVNHDASVIVGWVEMTQGYWRPAAWVSGSLVLLTDVFEVPGIPVGTGEARAASTTGDFIVGFSRDQASNQRAATMWTRTNGVFGPPQILGWVDGTEPAYGINVPYGVSSDGTMVVGYCSFDGSPFGTTGFVWTPSSGLVDVNQWLAGQGVLVDPNFTIQSLTAMTPDGTKIFGYGQMLTAPYTKRAFRITTSGTLDAPPAAQVSRLELTAPVPNPSSSDTRMEFSLASAADVDLSVYDAAGRRVATLLHEEVAAGRRSVTWDGREAGGQRVPAGLYFARLTTPHGAAFRRIVRVD